MFFCLTKLCKFILLHNLAMHFLHSIHTEEIMTNNVGGGFLVFQGLK